MLFDQKEKESNEMKNQDSDMTPKSKFVSHPNIRKPA